MLSIRKINSSTLQNQGFMVMWSCVYHLCRSVTRTRRNDSWNHGSLSWIWDHENIQCLNLSFCLQNHRTIIDISYIFLLNIMHIVGELGQCFSPLYRLTEFLYNLWAFRIYSTMKDERLMQGEGQTTALQGAPQTLNLFNRHGWTGVCYAYTFFYIITITINNITLLILINAL